MNETLPSMTSDELREIRAALGQSQRAMAAALGVGKRAYEYWEGGQRAIPGPAVILAKKLFAECERASK